MKKKYLILIIIAFLSSCASVKITPEDQAYLDKAMACPLSFMVPKDKIDEVWSRAHVWIAQYSDLKIQIATEYIIDTYNPTALNPKSILGSSPTFFPKYGYKAMRVETQNNYQITVQCFSSNSIKSDAVNRNAHILAYYIKSSKLKPHLIFRGK